MPNFGYDLSCTDDLTLEMREIKGQDDVRIVAQAAFRRLITPRGQLIDDLDYGFDLKSLLKKGMTPADIDVIPGLIRQELLKDERINTVDVFINSITIDTIDLSIQCTTNDDPFTLVISITEIAANLNEILFGNF